MTASSVRIGAAGGVAERRAHRLHRGQEAGHADELQRLDDASLHGEQGDRLLQIGGGVEAERGVRVQVRHPLAGGRERGGDLAGIGCRCEAAERRGPQRRQRQAADRGHDTIEFQRLEGPVVHLGIGCGYFR